MIIQIIIVLNTAVIKHNSEDDANRELFLAKIHECDNEFLNCLYVKEN